MYAPQPFGAVSRGKLLQLRDHPLDVFDDLSLLLHYLRDGPGPFAHGISSRLGAGSRLALWRRIASACA